MSSGWAGWLVGWLGPTCHTYILILNCIISVYWDIEKSLFFESIVPYYEIMNLCYTTLSNNPKLTTKNRAYIRIMLVIAQTCNPILRSTAPSSHFSVKKKSLTLHVVEAFKYIMFVCKIFLVWRNNYRIVDCHLMST